MVVILYSHFDLPRFAKGRRDERFPARRPYKQLAFLGLPKQHHFLWMTGTLSTCLSTLGILKGYVQIAKPTRAGGEMAVTSHLTISGSTLVGSSSLPSLSSRG